MGIPRNENGDQPLALLGPQREAPSLRAVLDRWGIDGPVGLAAPGWEEDEFDDGWVREAVGRPLVNAKLYELADQLFAEDPEVLQLLRQRQDELRRLREINKIQLDHLLAAARALMRREMSGESVSRQTELTLEQVRQVDHDYFHLVRDVIRTYDKRIDPWERVSVKRYRQRVLERMQSCQVLLIAGGHVGVLLNRLNLSRLLRYFHVPIIAWSGGAMAMSEKIVFFHQGLPHTTGDAELSRQGMSWFRSLILFPHGNRRLELQNRLEVALLARRFLPDQCLVLTSQSIMEWSSRELKWAAGIQRLGTDGSVEEWRP